MKNEAGKKSAYGVAKRLLTNDSVDVDADDFGPPPQKIQVLSSGQKVNAKLEQILESRFLAD